MASRTDRGHLEALPGAEIVLPGLEDLSAGRLTLEALFVLIGAPRLRRAGLDVPPVEVERPEHRAYEELARLHGDAAHGRYNALLRRLISFERALECAVR